MFDKSKLIQRDIEEQLQNHVLLIKFAQNEGVINENNM
jgi:hypothetical protein